MKINISDKATKIEYRINDFGFMVVDAVLSRTGIQEYLGANVGDSRERVKVYRSKDEVLSDDSLASFENAPITDDHPKDDVNIDNYAQLSKGSMSLVKETVTLDDGEFGIKSTLQITDKNLIKKIQDGKSEVSVGYTTEIVKQDGKHNEEEYHYVQKNIRVNHVAIVDKGRCGKYCKIIKNNDTIQNKIFKGKAMLIKVGDSSVEITDAEIAVKVRDALASKDVEIKDLKAQIPIIEAQRDTAISDKAVVIKDSESKIALADLASSVGRKIDLTRDAIDIKRDFVDFLGGDKAKDEAYLDAMIDIQVPLLMEKKKKTNDSYSAGGKDGSNKLSPEIQALKDAEDKLKGGD